MKKCCNQHFHMVSFLLKTAFVGGSLSPLMLQQAHVSVFLLRQRIRENPSHGEYKLNLQMNKGSMTHKFSPQVRSAIAISFFCLQSAALQLGVWIVHVAAHCHTAYEKRGETMFISNKF